ncbi:OmpA family protein [Vibrio hannami]|uniref:OmpA family protein n=1 Tax=Vibrio hannami TaxID=2717094 RepID=UPI00240F9D15|nr:OmpA family protein [Vibrio hannami]MDG3085670.1 OmpA family protein [Vibrio hannami]
MKKLIVLLALVLTGCSTSDMSQMMPGSKLDVAPKSSAELLHPDWVEVPTAQRDLSMVEGPYGERKSDSLDAFSYYLSQLGIEHEILPGEHLVIKLRKKVQFKTGSDKVSMDSQEWLSQLGYYVARMPNIDVVLEGHTDNTGSAAINERLSQKRALKVKDELVKQQVMPGAIFTRGFSDYKPRCSNKTTSGKACNRRVELSFILANN